MPMLSSLKPSFCVDVRTGLAATVKNTILSLLPNASFDSGRKLKVKADFIDNSIKTEVILTGSKYSWFHHDTEICDGIYDDADRQRRMKERLKLGIHFVISNEFQLPKNPWGILIGVRPTKIIHRLLDRGFSFEKIKSLLNDVYAVSQDRRDLLLEVSVKQRKFFHDNPNNPVSIYIGIPFCPTRCDYCSFAAYPLTTHSHLMGEFLQALEMEIKEISKVLVELGVRIESVYIGGGTPTTVQGDDLQKLLYLINRHFKGKHCKEFTVEAGRPETLTKEVVSCLQAAGIQRISINPQTMHNKTLRLIGREHTVEDVKKAFDNCREIGIPTINTDIILGLPGEDVNDLEHTLNEIMKLSPDCLTVHSLALKRASRLKRELTNVELKQTHGQAMDALTKNYAQALQMKPYYLYRQRMIFSNLENIGYAKEGNEGIYNIQMMEERQTIIGLGGGAITKFVGADLSVARHANPKCPATYSQQISSILATKRCQMQQKLTV